MDFNFSPCSQLPWWEQFGKDTIAAGGLSSFRPGGWWALEPSNGHPARPACSSGVGPVVRLPIPDYSPAPAGPVCLPLPGVSELGTASPAKARGRLGALGHPSPVWTETGTLGFCWHKWGCAEALAHRLGKGAGQAVALGTPSLRVCGQFRGASRPLVDTARLSRSGRARAAGISCPPPPRHGRKQRTGCGGWALPTHWPFRF